MEIPTDIRASACAGTWYPATETALRALVDRQLAAASPAPLAGGQVVALVAPHAGYAYSGPVAAHAYRAVQGEAVARVVLLGPLHRPTFAGQLGPVMASGEAAYETPLGLLPVDQDLLNRLAARVRLHIIRADEEHSLEMQMPFLQVALGDFDCVPLLLSLPPDDAHSLADCRALGDALADVIAASPGRTLLVAGADLAHLNDYAAVRAQDEALAQRVADFDIDGLAAALVAGEVYACRGAALVAVMQAARALGATQATPLCYAASGDITGDRRPGVFTVGYLAAALTR